ncbi:hypothetical protein LTS18_002932 [Coniosporium uncinatum]|uniref:Uncharacterized protein n=1 Tax=Coniosporium uncinatum TaxID=93489 RepID=A0ACC3DZM8_9PEZI|nr:hypothetical protein LTS18_002932 [Coniosporium uncinatum]
MQKDGSLTALELENKAEKLFAPHQALLQRLQQQPSTARVAHRSQAGSSVLTSSAQRATASAAAPRAMPDNTLTAPSSAHSGSPATPDETEMPAKTHILDLITTISHPHTPQVTASPLVNILAKALRVTYTLRLTSLRKDQGPFGVLFVCKTFHDLGFQMFFYNNRFSIDVDPVEYVVPLPKLYAAISNKIDPVMVSVSATIKGPYEGPMAVHKRYRNPKTGALTHKQDVRIRKCVLLPNPDYFSTDSSFDVRAEIRHLQLVIHPPHVPVELLGVPSLQQKKVEARQYGFLGKEEALEAAYFVNRDCEEIKRRHVEHKRQRHVELLLKDMEASLLPITKLDSEYGFVNLEDVAFTLHHSWHELPAPKLPH